MWERDNCPCPRCRHPSTHERLVMLVEPGDGPHDPPPTRPSPDPGALDRRPVATIPRVGFDDLRRPDTLADFVERVLSEGLVIVTGTPTVSGEVIRMAEHVAGWVRPTNFGTIFDVVSRPDPNSNAYTSLGLHLHTDLPYYTLAPDYQLLHALQADASGGDSLFADAIAAAEQLRDEQPEAFRTLCEWPVPFRFLDGATDLRHVAPVFTLTDGQVSCVRFNNGVRDLDWAARGPEGASFYDAYLLYWRLVMERSIGVRLTAGDVVWFDNHRWLHGRTAFDPSSGARHLQGCYVDRDALRSRLRVLRLTSGTPLPA